MINTDAVFAAALCLIVLGVAAIYWPAACIVAGGLLGLLAWSLDKAGDRP